MPHFLSVERGRWKWSTEKGWLLTIWGVVFKISNWFCCDWLVIPHVFCFSIINFLKRKQIHKKIRNFGRRYRTASSEPGSLRARQWNGTVFGFQRGWRKSVTGHGRGGVWSGPARHCIAAQCRRHLFDGVMVNADDSALRHNRLNLLKKLRDLFLQVADISQLVVSK